MLIDKPAGPTSHDVVARVRKALGIRRVGHTGTLDPFATGLLVVLAGRATRLARYVEGQDKVYRATARLGVTTDTDDLTGTVIGGTSLAVTDEAIAGAFSGLIGERLQRPPAFSAKHVDGRRSYQLARRGQAVPLPDVAVRVHALEFLGRRNDEVTFRARVGRGTYLRAIARDLGEMLGTGAHLTALRRECIGAMDVSSALPLDAVLSGVSLRPADAVLEAMPSVGLSGALAADFCHGRPVAWTSEIAEAVAVRDEERLIGIGATTGVVLRPTVVLVDPP